MKKTLVALMLTGSSMALFAQTPTTTPTSPTSPTNPTTTPTSTPTTTPTTGTMGSTTNNSTTGSTSDPMNTTTNSSMNNGSMNNGTMGTTGSSASTVTWNTTTPMNSSWSNYGIWNGVSATSNGAMNNGTMNNTTAEGTMNATSAGMSSTGSYNAYAATPVMAPANVQMNFSKDFPTTTGNSYSWNQYGDWFYTSYMNNGRLTQYFYNPNGNGYSLSLPVLNSYVPENIVTQALQRYGSTLYSISMVKTNDGVDAYQLGILDRGQMRTEIVGEDGVALSNYWRTEEMNNTTGTMSTMDANAAMGTGSTATVESDGEKTVIKDEKGMKTKIKTKDNGKVKIKSKKTDD